VAGDRAELGRRAEALVADYLAGQGFAIVGRNVRVGRDELDLIARRGELVVFCEVRCRSHGGFMHPAESIDRAKQLRVRRAAARWLSAQRLGSSEVRFDAAAVLRSADGALVLDYFDAAF
jgi:putative endonuclease